MNFDRYKKDRVLNLEDYIPTKPGTIHTQELLEYLRSNEDISELRLSVGGGYSVNIKKLCRSPAVSKLTTLSLHGTISLDNMRKITQSSHLTKLEHFKIESININDKYIELITNSPNFKHLTSLGLVLAYEIKSTGIKLIAESPNFKSLTSLNLSGTGIADDAIRLIAESPNFKSLTSLDLSDTKIADDAIRLIAESPNFKSLTSLNLSGTGIADDAIRLIAESPNFKSLTSLDLSDTKIADDAIRLIAESPNFKILTSLNLSGTKIADDAIRLIAESPNFKSLTSLNLSGTGIADDAIRLIAESPNFKSLTSLNLSGYNAKITDLLPIFTSQNLANLERLFLIDMQRPLKARLMLKDAKLVTLKKLTHLKLARSYSAEEIALFLLQPSANIQSLKYLDLTQTNLDVVIREIANSPHLSSLTSLKLAHNNINNNEMLSLIYSPNLKGLADLDLSFNRITDAGVATLISLSTLKTLPKIDLSYVTLGPQVIESIITTDSGYIKVDNDDATPISLFYRMAKHVFSTAHYTDPKAFNEFIVRTCHQIARQENTGEIIKYIIQNPDKYSLLINSVYNGHTLDHYYTHNSEMLRMLFTHGLIPSVVQRNDLVNVVNDAQSVHQAVVVKKNNFITDILVKSIGQDRNTLPQKAQDFSNELSSLFNRFNNKDLEIKLLGLTEAEKHNVMENVLDQDALIPDDRKFVDTVLSNAQNVLKDKYLTPQYASRIQYAWNEGAEKYITIPEVIGLTKSVIDNVVITRAEKQELLVTLYAQYQELIHHKASERILGHDFTIGTLYDHTELHKFLEQIDESRIEILFQELTNLDIVKVRHTQKEFILAKQIYVASTAYGESNSACLQGIWSQIIEGATEIKPELLDSYAQHIENLEKHEANLPRLTEYNSKGIVEDVLRQTSHKLDIITDIKKLEVLQDLAISNIDVTHPTEITISQQSVLAEVNNALLAKIREYLPNYRRAIPSSDEYQIIIDNISASPDAQKISGMDQRSMLRNALADNQLLQENSDSRIQQKLGITIEHLHRIYETKPELALSILENAYHLSKLSSKGTTLPKLLEQGLSLQQLMKILQDIKSESVIEQAQKIGLHGDGIAGPSGCSGGRTKRATDCEFTYEPLRGDDLTRAQKAKHKLFAAASIAIAWKSKGAISWDPSKAKTFNKNIGDLINEGRDNWSTREQKLIKKYNKRLKFLDHNNVFSEIQGDAIGQKSITLYDNGKSSILVFKYENHFKVFSLNLNYQQILRTADNIAPDALAKFVKQVFVALDGASDFKTYTLSHNIPKKITNNINKLISNNQRFRTDYQLLSEGKIPGIKNFKKQQTLGLSGRNFRDQDIEQLIKIKGLDKTKTLILDNNHIGVNGLNAILDSTNLRNLLEISVRDNKLDIKDSSFILQNSASNKLSVLDLSQNQLDLKAIEYIALAENSKLQIVTDLEHNQLKHQIQQYGGYQSYLDNMHVENIASHIHSSNIGGSLKTKLVSAAGKAQLIHAVHGIITTCNTDGAAGECAYSLAGFGYSFLSGPIEHVATKYTTTVVNNAMRVGSKLGTVKGLKVDFLIKVGVGRYVIKFAKGAAGAAAGLFDIIDIARASIVLDKCFKKSGTKDECSDKEVRDAIANISFSSVSFVGGTVIAVIAGSSVGVIFGVAVLAGTGIYQGISNIIEYEEKYDTTHDENWSIFWRSLLLIPMHKDITELAYRHNVMNTFMDKAVTNLKELPDDIVGYALGLGELWSKRIVIGQKPCPGGGGVPQCMMDVSQTIFNVTVGYSAIDMTQSGVEGTAEFKKASIKGLYYNRATKKLCYPVEQFGPFGERANITECVLTTLKSLSRVVPKAIPGIKMLCLPQATQNSYDRNPDTHHLTKDSEYYCENAVVISNITRAHNAKKPSIIYDLTYINAGVIIGSNEYNNIFYINKGNNSITGGKDTTNHFLLLDDSFHGTIQFEHNSTNIIDTSQLSGKNIKITWPLSDFMDISFNDRESPIRASQIAEQTKIHIQGSKNNVDTIICSMEDFTSKSKLQDHVLVDTGGTNRTFSPDWIKNCTDVVVWPNTYIVGDSNNYKFYIKTSGFYEYNTKSEIDIKGNATVVFMDISLLINYNIITYYNDTNTMSVYMKSNNNKSFTLSIRNYRNQDGSTNITFIDKHGSTIIPLFSDGYERIHSFNVYNTCPSNIDTPDHRELMNACERHWNSISVSKGNDKIFGILQVPLNDAIKNMIFGSKDTDIISLDANTIYAQGNNGQDMYIINVDYGYAAFYINNEAKDSALDMIKIQGDAKFELYKSFQDLVVKVINPTNASYTTIKITNYFESPEYQHLIILDHQYNCFMPALISIYSRHVDLMPFYHAGIMKNVFEVRPSTRSAIIDNEYEMYRSHDDIIFILQNKAAVLLKDFYVATDQWQNFELYRYDTYHSNLRARVTLNDLDTVPFLETQQKHIVSGIFEVYDVDFTHNEEIFYNLQNIGTDLHLIPEQEQKIGIISFNNIYPSDISISQSNLDLVLSHNVLNTKIIIARGGDNNTSHSYISIYEFRGLPQLLEPIIIYSQLNTDYLISDQFSNAQQVYDLYIKLQTYKFSRTGNCFRVDTLKYVLAYNNMQGMIDAQTQAKAIGFDSVLSQMSYIQSYIMTKDELIQLQNCINSHVQLVQDYRLLLTHSLRLHPYSQLELQKYTSTIDRNINKTGIILSIDNIMNSMEDTDDIQGSSHIRHKRHHTDHHSRDTHDVIEDAHSASVPVAASSSTKATSLINSIMKGIQSLPNAIFQKLVSSNNEQHSDTEKDGITIVTVQGEDFEYINCNTVNPKNKEHGIPRVKNVDSVIPNVKQDTQPKYALPIPLEFINNNLILLPVILKIWADIFRNKGYNTASKVDIDVSTNQIDDWKQQYKELKDFILEYNTTNISKEDLQYINHVHHDLKEIRNEIANIERAGKSDKSMVQWITKTLAGHAAELTESSTSKFNGTHTRSSQNPYADYQKSETINVGDKAVICDLEKSRYLSWNTQGQCTNMNEMDILNPIDINHCVESLPHTDSLLGNIRLCPSIWGS